MAIKRSDAAGEVEETRNLAQEIARRSVSQLEGSLARITAEASATGRWLLAALVLLNGGGVTLTVARAAGMTAPTIGPALILFIFGASLAVIAALVSAASAIFMARPIGEASGHWAQVSVTGDISDAAMKSVKSVRWKSMIWASVPLVAALASLMLFMTGAMTLADGVAPPEQPEISAAEAALANAAQAPAAAADVIAPAANVIAPVASVPTPTATPTATPAPQSSRAPVPVRRAPAERRATLRPQQRVPAQATPVVPGPAPSTAPVATPSTAAGAGN